MSLQVETVYGEGESSFELQLAAFDQTVHPSMLLLTQACLPFPPSEESQHSIRALSALVHR